jgi:hypothetical protein
MFLDKYQKFPEKVKQKNDYMVIGRSPINDSNRHIIVSLLSDIDVENSVYVM